MYEHILVLVDIVNNVGMVYYNKPSSVLYTVVMYVICLFVCAIDYLHIFLYVI